MDTMSLNIPYTNDRLQSLSSTKKLLEVYVNPAGNNGGEKESLPFRAPLGWNLQKYSNLFELLGPWLGVCCKIAMNKLLEDRYSRKAGG
jgi:hypothetical protein